MKSGLAKFCLGRRLAAAFPTLGLGEEQQRRRRSEDVDPAARRAWEEHAEASDRETREILWSDMIVYPGFLSPEEAASLLEEVDPYMKRLRYEYSHWDHAIHGYRETERKHWTEKSKSILQRVTDLAFPPSVPKLTYVHILDIEKAGYIKPHIDAVRFCGNTIAGLSLLSSCVMRLVQENNREKFCDFLLKPQSLYIMKNKARYEFTHEVLPESESIFRSQHVPRDRRISIICRNEPES